MAVGRRRSCGCSKRGCAPKALRFTARRSNGLPPPACSNSPNTRRVTGSRTNRRFPRHCANACDVVGYYRRAIEPVLERGTVVLWDRSPLCYRAYARAYGADPQWGDRLYATIPAPSVTVLLDLSPAVALQRLIARQTQPIRRDENVELLTRVRNV